MIADLTIYPSPYSDPALAQYRDVPVTTTVCVPSSKLIELRQPSPMADVIEVAALFVLAWVAISAGAYFLSREWMRNHPAQTRSAKRELERVFGRLRPRKESDGNRPTNAPASR